MHTITLQVNNENALKVLRDLETKHFIDILDNTDPSLPGKPLSLQDFKTWISVAEQTSTVSLNEAKEKWASKKKQLRQINL